MCSCLSRCGGAPTPPTNATFAAAIGGHGNPVLLAQPFVARSDRLTKMDIFIERPRSDSNPEGNALKNF